MSHFSVLVVGDDHEFELAPFHEFECTGRADEFVHTVDDTDEWSVAYAEYQVETGDSPPSGFLPWVAEYTCREVLRPGVSPDLDGEHRLGWIVADGETVLQTFKRTNPNSHWDWYAVGGRFHDSLILRDGRHADTALKRDIDFEAMRTAEAFQAGRLWDEVHTATKGLWLPWETVLAKCSDVEEARDVYRAQPAIRNLHASEAMRGVFEYDEFLASRETYVQQARAAAVGGWALVRDRTWEEKGSMGWFGMAEPGERTDAEWYAHCWAVIQALPDDARLTVVDCHI